MDKLCSFLESMTPTERQSFRNALKTSSKGSDNKRLRLFDLVAKDKCPAEIRSSIYPDASNPDNAYYQLRKVLICELELFLLQHRNTVDSAQLMLRSIELADQFADRQQYELAWHYLKEAEELANMNGSFEMLYPIYHIKMKICEREPALRTQLIDLRAKSVAHLGLLADINTLNSLKSEAPDKNSKLEDLTWKICQEIHSCQSIPNQILMSKKIALLIKNGEPTRSELILFHSFMGKLLLSSDADLHSIQNRQDFYALQVELCMSLGDAEATNNYLSKWERLLKSTPDAKTEYVLKAVCYRIEQLVNEGNTSLAWDKLQKTWSRYEEQVRIEQRLTLLQISIGLAFILEREDQMLHYFKLLEQHKEAFIQLLGAELYSELILLRCALLIELQEPSEAQKALSNLDKLSSSDYVSSAIEVLQDIYRTSKDGTGIHLNGAVAGFLTKYPSASFRLRNPDFRWWLRARQSGERTTFNPSTPKPTTGTDHMSMTAMIPFIL